MLCPCICSNLQVQNVFSDVSGPLGGVQSRAQCVAAAVERITVNDQYWIGPVYHVDVLLDRMR